MQISAVSTAYGGDQAQRLLAALLQQASGDGQDLPSDAASKTGDPPPAASPGPPPSGAPGAQFAANTLSGLLSTQEQSASSSDKAAALIKQADTNGDGVLSATEIRAALGGDSVSGTNGADGLAKAISALDSNGDGQLNANELTAGLDAAKPQHAHHHPGGPHSASDIASKVMGAVDTGGDGALNLDEVQTALGSDTASAGGGLSQAFATLDSNADGKLSATELSTAIDAFRTAHQNSSAASPQASITA